MSPKSNCLSPSHSQKQQQKKHHGHGVFGDVYSMMTLPFPKDMIMIGSEDKDPPLLDSRFHLQLPNLAQPFREFFGTREVGEFVSGALAGAMTKAVLAPLETIRTRMVVGVGSKNITGSFVQVIEEQGWQGLWAGNTINMVLLPAQSASHWRWRGNG